MRKVILTVLALFQFLVSILFAIESGLAVFVAVRTRSTGRFHGMPFTARHDLLGAVDAFILALFFFWSGYVCLRFRRPSPSQGRRMLKRISGGELLARMTVWWLLLLSILVGFVLYDFALLSPEGLTRLLKVTVSIAIPAFLLHQWVLNRRKKRKSSGFGNNGGEP